MNNELILDDPHDAAEYRAIGIRTALQSMIENRDYLLAKIEEARTAQDHIVLGYKSWTTYVAEEFGGLLAELHRDDRRSISAVLSDIGMSVRAIATVTGVSIGTAHADVTTGVQSLNTCPDLGQVCQSDTPETATPPPAEQGVRQVTGLDGRKYAAERPERRKPRRRPLPDQWRTAVYELDRAMERLVRLSGDDRFAQYAPDLAQGSANPLQRISKQLWSIRRDLGQPSTYRVDLEDGGDQ